MADIAQETTHGPASELHAGTEVPGGHAEAHPTLLGLDAEGWVYAGITIFFLLAIFVGKAPKLIAEKLDQRIADTRRQLDEARAIRAEAEKLLGEAKAQQKAAAKDAAAIVKHAEVEAAQLVTKAEEDADALISRRRRMAEDKIAAAERAALEGVRQAAAEAAAKAAQAVIASSLTKDDGARLIDQSIGEIDRRLN